MSSDDTSILIRLPSELKAMYRSLCDSRGVTVSSELRSFMIEQINLATIPDNSIKLSDAHEGVSSVKATRAPYRSHKHAKQAKLHLTETQSAIKASQARKKTKKPKKR